MRYFSPDSSFVKALGIVGIFSFGALSHWTYLQISKVPRSVQSGPARVADTKAAQNPRSVATVTVAAKPSKSPQLVSPEGDVDRLIAIAARIPAPVRALHFPAALTHAGALAFAEREIIRSARTGPPLKLDLKVLAVAAVRTRILETELALRVLEKRFIRKLRKERFRLMLMAAKEISRIASVTGPAPISGLNPVAVPPVAVGTAPTTGNALSAISVVAGDVLARAAAKPPETLVAYARLPDALLPPAGAIRADDSPIRKTSAKEAIDLSAVREAIEAYRKGEMESGDAHARRATNDVTRTALEWAALRLQPRKAGFKRIQAFSTRYPNWPRRQWLQWRAEQSLFIDPAARRHVGEYLAGTKPASPIGRLVQARHLLRAGKKTEANKVVVEVWRNDRINGWLEKTIIKEFGSLLSSADHKYRSDGEFYKERFKSSVRTAGRAGKDIYAFAAARVAVARGVSPDKLSAKFSSKYRKDPSWYFAQAQRLRRAEKPQAAAKVFLASNAPAEDIIDPAAWWAERRMVARRLLDDGDAKTAYAVTAGHRVDGGAAFVDAEFYSGWLALRFLKKPKVALGHFSRAMAKATRPLSRSRAAYWQARAAELSPEPEDAERLYAIAAEYSSSYYGQLAHARLKGASDVPLRKASSRAIGAARLLPIRVVDVLKRVDEDALALELAVGLAKHCEDESQISALAGIMKRERDARGSLIIGKLASYRGIELDDIAFPDFGVPNYTPLANSADKSMVYAIARQESAFRAKAVSHAGAKGLMQMLTSTARRTAKSKGVPFSPDRLVSDPAFNAQLGAAHIGELIQEHPGSMILVFAAYNAGGPRVKQWIKAYGDPRKPGVDPIDWVERIPISETRNYVQRVTENLGVYRKILGSHGIPHVALRDLRASAARY